MYGFFGQSVLISELKRSILVSRQELVGWLQHQIAEQKRADLATSAAPSIPEVGASGSLISKDVSISPDIQLVLPVDAKKQRKQVKQLFLDRGLSHDPTFGHLSINHLILNQLLIPQWTFDLRCRMACPLSLWMSQQICLT